MGLAASVEFRYSPVHTSHASLPAWQFSFLQFSDLVLSGNFSCCPRVLRLATRQSTGTGAIGTAAGAGGERTASAQEPIAPTLSVQYVTRNRHVNRRQPRESQGQRAKTLQLAPHVTRLWKF